MITKTGGRRSSVLTALLTASLLGAGAGAVHADNIVNDLDASVDAVAEVMPLDVGGGNGTTQLYVTPTNGDGKNGCNLTGSTTLTLDVGSSDPSVATVSPSSVTFASCGETKTLTVTPVGAGSATVSTRETGNSTGGSFDLAPATFTVNVTAPANTTPANAAPGIAVSGVTGGASYAKGSVPAATCSVTDAEDGPSSFPAALSAVSGPYAVDGIGSQTASCSYTDGGGVTASASETYTVVDPSAPVIGRTVTPTAPDGQNGWYRSNVSVVWAVSEPESPSSLQKAGCVDETITSDQAATTYTCSATSAGGSAAEQSVTIKRDATEPTIRDAGVSAATLGSNGWYTTAVSNTFEAGDATSGLADAANSRFSVGTGDQEGSGITVSSGPVSDVAGNTHPGIDSRAFNVDLSDPRDITFVGGPAAGSSHYFGSVPSAPTCTATDDVSGLASCVVTGHSTAVGTHTLTATATDAAGRTATATRSYSVLAWNTKGFYSPVDMGGVLNTVKGGSTVPLKFEVFAGVAPGGELTSTAAIGAKLTYGRITASNGTTDEIETVSTGATELRYDGTSGQFVYNWKTPTGSGSYRVTVTLADGSTISADFRTR